MPAPHTHTDQTHTYSHMAIHPTVYIVGRMVWYCSSSAIGGVLGVVLLLYIWGGYTITMYIYNKGGVPMCMYLDVCMYVSRCMYVYMYVCI